MPQNRSQRGRSALIILVLIMICIASLVLVLIIWVIPAQVSRQYGPLATTIGDGQRLIYSVQLITSEKNLIYPTDPGGKDQVFHIEMGESVDSVALRLENDGLISSAVVFRTYLIYTGLDTRLQAGEYTLSPAMTPVQIGQKLLDATPLTINFTILPGWRIEEIAASLPTSGLEIRPDDFLRAAQNPSLQYPLLQDYPDIPSLEGYCFPGSYILKRDTSVTDFLGIILLQFEQNITPEMLASFNRQNLSLREAVTLASIVQKESVINEEQPIIASVFLNRLTAGMKLDSDPTVQYAIGYNADQKTWWTNPLSLDNLKVDSPYNTYLYPGLPPSPIANPSLSALQAVAYPAQTPYYYFRALCDGSGKHAFARTYEEHLENQCP